MYIFFFFLVAGTNEKKNNEKKFFGAESVGLLPKSVLQDLIVL